MESVQAAELYPPLYPPLWPSMWPDVWEPRWRPDAVQLAPLDIKATEEGPAASPVEAAVADASFQPAQDRSPSTRYTEQPSLQAAVRQQPPQTVSGLSWVGQRIALAQWQEQQS